ncbi:hypothetical protein CPAV1605_1019 [seawater metagenome]|uniref:Nudix hydrolase domain-containing protein n=1 Tax=seawater metagenome TaxID=1561972 RepID=A0A5E8CJ44_9ZZZZ
MFLTVDIIIYDKDSKEFALIKRKGKTFNNYWAIPGGFVENDESDIAARRN